MKNVFFSFALNYEQFQSEGKFIIGCSLKLKLLNKKKFQKQIELDAGFSFETSRMVQMEFTPEEDKARL